MTKPKNQPERATEGKGKGRPCRGCGFVLPAFTPEYVADRLRRLHAEIPLRRPKRGESEAQRAVARADWYEGTTIHAQVTIALLADEADGYCAKCAPSGLRADAEATPKA